MKRRPMLIAATGGVAVLLAGCTYGGENTGSGDAGGGDEVTDENDAESDPTPTTTLSPSSPTLTDIIRIPEHKWRSASVLQLTIQNRTQDTLDLVQVESNLYVENERIAHSFTNISGLAGGKSTTSEIRFSGYNQDPCNATRYDLFPNFYYDNTQYEQRFEYEFNPEFFE